MEFNIFYITTISEVAANKHNSLPNKNLLVLGKLKFRMYECKLNNFKFAQSL